MERKKVEVEQIPKWGQHRVGKANPRNENIRDMYPLPESPGVTDITKTLMYKGKYEADMTEELSRLARFGLTNDEIAEFYGVTMGTLSKYLSNIPELGDALQRGRMLDSMKVVDSLHKQALGYHVEETVVAQHVTRQGDIVELTSKSTKYVQPSATAAIYLLKTRHGDKWMDIVRTDSTRRLDITVKNVDFSDMSTDELLQLKNLGIKSIPEEFTGRRNKQLPTQDVRGN